MITSRHIEILTALDAPSGEYRCRMREQLPASFRALTHMGLAQDGHHTDDGYPSLTNRGKDVLRVILATAQEYYDWSLTSPITSRASGGIHHGGSACLAIKSFVVSTGDGRSITTAATAFTIGSTRSYDT